MSNYLPRLLDELLDFKLQTKGAVVIEGAKWCGKTTTAKKRAASSIIINSSEVGKEIKAAIEIQYNSVLRGKTPRLIDEWQVVPELWNAVRIEVDERGEFGQFILTGSVSPEVDRSGYTHSGVGRFAWLTMRPMTLFESSDSTGDVSLSSLFNGQDQVEGANPSADISKLAFLTCRGGWPIACVNTNNEKIALAQAYDYVNAIGKRDDNKQGESFNRILLRNFLRSYARNIGTPTSLQRVAQDSRINEETAYSYHLKLSSLFVIEDMEAWNPNLRSKVAIRSTPTRYFVDSSIATASLGIGPDDLCNDLKTFGFMFENLCVRDLRVYSQLLDGEVFHFRDKTGLECDAVIHLYNGAYGLVEIKLGGATAIEQAATNLQKLATKIDSDSMGKPAFLMVLTGSSQFAYTRKDGVHVVPITCLKP